MNTKPLLMVALVASLAGCGGGGGSDDSAPSTPSNTSISTTTQGSSVAASSSQAASLASGSVQLSSVVGGAVTGAPTYHSPLASKDQRLNKLNAAQLKLQKAVRARAATLKKAAVVMPTTEYTCGVSGSYIIGGTYDDQTFAYNMTLQYNNCIEYDMKMNGSMSVTGKDAADGMSGTMSMVYGSGNGTLGDGDDFLMELYENNYAILYASTKMDMTIAGSYGFADTADGYSDSFNMTANGKAEYKEPLSSFTITYQNFAGNSTQAYNYTSGDWSGTDIFNGSILESWTEGGNTQSVTVTYTAFASDWFWEGSWLYDTYAINGKIAINYNPDITCSNGASTDGTFTIATVTPIKYDYSVGHTTEGNLTINGNTDVQYNADGSVTVTVDGTAQNYSSPYQLEMLCPIADMSSNTGDATLVDTTQGDVVASGTTLVGNLSWTPNLMMNNVDSIQDLHVAYYATATPTSIQTPDWVINWYNRDVTGVLPDTDTLDGNLPYYSESNTSGSEATDFDRLVINGLPAGYYVVVVNSYDLGYDNTSYLYNTSVTGSVMLTIGSSNYDFGSRTFTVSDSGGGTDASAWWRIADLVVDGSGTVTIKAPDLNLAPWMSGLMAPSVAKGSKRLVK